MRYFFALLSLFLWVEVGQTTELKTRFDCSSPLAFPDSSRPLENYLICQETIQGGFFQPDALEICRKPNDFPSVNECLKIVKNVPFQNEALNLCQKINRGSNTDTLFCLRTIAGKKYSISSLHTCEDETYRLGFSLYTCLDKSPSTILPVAVSPSDTPLPQGTQIILMKDLAFPALNTCTQLKNKQSGLACDICVNEASDEDRVLKARTMIIHQSQQGSKRLQTDFEIVNDPSVKTVRCVSNEPMNLADKPGLREKLEKLGLGLSLPTPKDF